MIKTCDACAAIFLFCHLWCLNLFICYIIHSVYFQQGKKKNLDLVWSCSLFNSPRISALQSEWFCVIKIALHSSPNLSIGVVNGGLELLIDSTGPHERMYGLHICNSSHHHLKNLFPLLFYHLLSFTLWVFFLL